MGLHVWESNRNEIREVLLRLVPNLETEIFTDKPLSTNLAIPNLYMHEYLWRASKPLPTVRQKPIV